jgi:hypothetical protein
MSTEIDFKALWNREQTGAPDVTEIFAKANRMNYYSRKKIWICNIVLSLTIALYILIWWHYQPQFVTTKIGLTLMIAAMVIFIITTNQLSPLLARANLETDTNAFLSQMIRIKHKQEFIDKTVLAIYFITLAVGLGLYLIEYASRGKLIFQVCVYGISLLLLAANWFYVSARNARKQRKAMNEIIAKLEAVNRQMGN